jgi:hypothetical protein
MFNNRIVIAQKKLFIDMLSAVGKNYDDYQEIINKYNSVFKPIAVWMLVRDAEEFEIDDIVSHLTQYINRKKLNPGNIKVSKSNIVINDQSIPNKQELINFVHANFPVAKKQEDNVQQSETNHTPILTGDGIRVFKVEKAQDSKQLAGDTSWCIAYQGANNMWQSYRSNQAATFYIVWDENPPTPNQRKVALQFNNNNVQITDIPNRTGSNLSDDISFQYEGKMITGRDISTYLTYLKSKGVNIDATTTNPETGEEEKVLRNKPITPEEKLETSLYQNISKYYTNPNVDDIKSWSTGKFVLRSTSKDGFIKDNGDNTYSFSSGGYLDRPIAIPEEMIAEKTHLGKSAGILPSESMSHLLESVIIESESVKTYLTKFIGMGWILPNDIFDYLFDVPGGKDYLVQYVNTGLELPKDQRNKLQTDKQLFNSYVKQQLTAWEMGHNDGEILKYLDPNNPSDKEKVLKAFSKTKNFRGIPQNWKENVPQIGISVAGIGDDITLNDPLAEKLAIAKGMFKVYKKNPTLENTRIYLHTPEAIEPLKAQAEAEGYNSVVLNAPGSFDSFAGRFSLIPDEFKNLPEFYEISKIGQVTYKSRYDFIQKIRSKDESEFTQDDLETGVALVVATGTGVNHTPLEYSGKFWNYLYDNYERYYNGRFSRVGLEVREIPDDVDEEDEDYDEEEFPFRDDPGNRKFLIDKSISNIPGDVLRDSDLREKFLKRFGNKELVSKLLSSGNRANNVNIAAEYVNSIQDLPISITGYLTYNKNPITEKILRTSSLDEYNNYMKKNRSKLDIRDYARLLDFYPFISNQITDEMLLKEWRNMNYITPTEKFDVFNSLINTRPEFFRNHWQEIDLLPVWIYDLKEKNIIGTQNPQPIQETDEQMQESLNNVFKNMSASPEEKDVLASVNSMLKIAQKLDFKKEYRLADKLTYIIRKQI